MLGCVLSELRMEEPFFSVGDIPIYWDLRLKESRRERKRGQHQHQHTSLSVSCPQRQCCPPYALTAMPSPEQWTVGQTEGPDSLPFFQLPLSGNSSQQREE